jgi:cytochrome c-type biogenesis protein CcmH/NrfG
VQLLEHVVAIYRRVLAEDHPDRLTTQYNLARAYQANGQVKEAVQLLEHVVAIEGRVLAEDHPDRLASQRALARAYEGNTQSYPLLSPVSEQANKRSISPLSTTSLTREPETAL